jgi:hypothetical protein
MSQIHALSAVKLSSCPGRIMKVEMERRAEIALRSVDPSEQEQINRAVAALAAADREALFANPNLRRLGSPSGEELYVYRGSPRLRLILSIDDDKCTIEDIVPHDRTGLLLRGAEQQ